MALGLHPLTLVQFAHAGLQAWLCRVRQALASSLGVASLPTAAGGLAGL
jgi:hypothetical protein